jgi:hypothetical protein
LGGEGLQPVVHSVRSFPTGGRGGNGLAAGLDDWLVFEGDGDPHGHAVVAKGNRNAVVEGGGDAPHALATVGGVGGVVDGLGDGGVGSVVEQDHPADQRVGLERAQQVGVVLDGLEADLVRDQRLGEGAGAPGEAAGIDLAEQEEALGSLQPGHERGVARVTSPGGFEEGDVEAGGQGDGRAGADGVEDGEEAVLIRLVGDVLVGLEGIGPLHQRLGEALDEDGPVFRGVTLEVPDPVEPVEQGAAPGVVLGAVGEDLELHRRRGDGRHAAGMGNDVEGAVFG